MTRLETPEGERWEYKYAPFGRRISKRCTNRDKPGTDFHWNGDQLTEEIPVGPDGSSQDENAIRWIYEPGSFTPLARYEKGQLHYAITDTVGRVQELLTGDGTIVWQGKQQLWGRENGLNKEDAPTCHLRFPGQYEDAESGLYYNRFRYYDCDTGQYLCADPVGLAGGINPYSYVPNPLKWIDLLGLCKGEIDPKKFDYFFGRITSSPHNTARSQQMATVMKQLGVQDNAGGYKILTEHLMNVAGNPSNIVNRFSKVIDGKDVQFITKDSLFPGPSGKFAQFESTWQVLDTGSVRLTTVIPKL